MTAKNIERLGMMGLLATGLIWMECERRRLVGEIAEVRAEWAVERKANADLLRDFRARLGKRNLFYQSLSIAVKLIGRAKKRQTGRAPIPLK
jgi:hypothetical protein